MRRNTFAVVVVSLLVALAGCSGGGPAADDGPGDETETATDVENRDGGGDEGDQDGGDAGGSETSEGWEPFQFDQPGTYTYDVFLEGEGEGRVVWDVTSVSDDQFTVKVNYDVGDTQFESEVTGSRETIHQQLMMSPAGSLMVLTVISPATWYDGRELEVGNGWSYQTNEGTGSFEITGTKTIGGVSCFTSEMTVNGTIMHEGCFSPDHGLAPHSAFYDEDGSLQMELELVSYEPGN